MREHKLHGVARAARPCVFFKLKHGRAAHATIMNTIRCGLIGYGAWGQHHARAIASVAGASLTAICARSEASAEQAPKNHPQAAIYSDYRRMLESEKLD